MWEIPAENTSSAHVEKVARSINVECNVLNLTQEFVHVELFTQPLDVLEFILALGRLQPTRDGNRVARLALITANSHHAKKLAVAS